MGRDMERRALLRGAAGLGLAGLVPAGVLAEILSGCSGATASPAFDGHEREVITEATARLIPGPLDDPAEVGHPGAREANVTRYITTLVGAFSVQPPRLFAGGPFSNRHGSSVDYMAQFAEPSPSRAENWRGRLAKLAAVYHAGIVELDRRARTGGAGDFLRLDAPGKDRVLASNPKVQGLPAGYSGFTDLLFEHAIEGMYSVPEYGGNAGEAGWRDVGFPGDVQPRGYTPAQVSSPLRTGRYTPTGAVARLVALVTATAPPPPAPGGGS